MPDTLEPFEPTADRPDPATRSAADPGVTGSVADPAFATGGPGIRTVADAPAPPASAGRYELGAEVARGGMGAVYRATDTAFAREVAVKVLLDKFGPTSGTARRFHDEARITGQLQHPNIPAVHDLGTLPDGRPFLAMKLIKGDTLDDLLKARPNPSAERGRFVAAFEQVCQAVAYAHAHGVIHRDLKPGNVMVGSFGEVQVMDWGLAKVVGSREAEATDPDETASPTAIHSIRETDSAFTQAGSVLGTPAYMPPEQAIGAIHKVDARSDVFGLGAILAVILTGKPPFVGSSVETTRLQAAQGNVEECFARLDASGAEPELVSLCKRCLSKKSADRPADAGEVAKAVAELRAAADERARQAETERARAETQAVEQRKRRRVQLALAGVVLLVAVGGGIAALQVQAQRDADRYAAEQKRQDDLRAAEEVSKQKQREAKAEALARALAGARPEAVPLLLAELADYRDLARPYLRALAARPVQERAGLHSRVALLADPAALTPEESLEFKRNLVGHSLRCRVDELPLILDQIAAHFREKKLIAEFWGMLADRRDPPALFGDIAEFRPTRMATILARLDPTNPWWPKYAELIASELVRMNPLELEPFVEALRPVRGHLLPPLLAGYPKAYARIKEGTLAVRDLAAEATAFDLTANLLARYATTPADLAELSLIADPRHYPLFAPALRAKKAEVVPLLKAEVAKGPPEKLAVDKVDAALEGWGKRRGYAAAVLVSLGEGESVWPLLVFPKDGDPTARSYLLERLAQVGADPLSLMARFEADGDVSAKRALLVALGDFPLALVPAAEREALTAKLLVLYREHPDPGLHGAIDWLLRQKAGGGSGEPAGGSPTGWRKAKELGTIDAELAAAARGRVAARALADAAVPVGLPAGLVGPQLPAPRVAEGKDWFVNGEGQTFAVVRGPVEFTLGSPASEPGRVEVNEPPHRKRIGRTFAIATKEVTMAEFQRFRPGHEKGNRYSPGPDTPAVAMTWYQAAEYCNWLSAREGIPSDQWCYEPNKAGEFGEGMRMRAGHLKLTGYRLPTEAEWEYACRGGAVTARYFGRGEELLPRYGWFVKNADDHAWAVGGLRPNELGLFDALGNAYEWVEDPALLYATGRKDDIENSKFVLIEERMSRLLRGGSFYYQPLLVRSANRNSYRPGLRYDSLGLRPTRTLPGG